MNEKQARLQEWITDSPNIVFFGGAGVSTASGIPDFPRLDVLYPQQEADLSEPMARRTVCRRAPGGSDLCVRRVGRP